VAQLVGVLGPAVAALSHTTGGVTACGCGDDCTCGCRCCGDVPLANVDLPACCRAPSGPPPSGPGWTAACPCGDGHGAGLAPAHRQPALIEHQGQLPLDLPAGHRPITTADATTSRPSAPDDPVPRKRR
jgi:hypothetical protein